MDTLTVQVLRADSEIDQVNIWAALIAEILALQDDIIGLQITVNEAQIVDRLESFKHSNPNLNYSLKRKFLVFHATDLAL